MKTGLSHTAVEQRAQALPNPRELFRARFQRALQNCVRRRFSVAECFGVIWMETLEEVALSDAEQSELYEELIHWAKFRLFPDVIHSHSPQLFTGTQPPFEGNPEPRLRAI